MKPRLITNQMIQDVKYNIEKKKMYIQKNNNYYTNIVTFLVIISFIYYLYYKYNNKNEIVKKKKEMKQNFSNELFNYYNQIKRQEMINILNSSIDNKIFNEYSLKNPNLVNMNYKEWVKKPLNY